jgi:rubrerythrin
MSKKTLVKLIAEQIKIEETFVTDIENQIGIINNVAAKMLLLETQKDSEKHSIILRGILEVLGKKDVKPLWDDLKDSFIDKEVVRRNLERHIKTEAAMLEHINRIMKETEDEGIKLLLEHIASDEKKHHKILQTVIQRVHRIKP